MRKLTAFLLILCLLLKFTALAETATEAVDTVTESTEVESVEDVPIDVETARTELSYGDKGNDVLALQQKLNELGYKCGTPDGQFGSNTRLAVAEFQRRNGLNESGVADAETLSILNSGYAVPAYTKSQVYVDRVTVNNGFISVAVSNASSETVTGVTCVFLTLNTDYSLSSNCGHPCDINYYGQEVFGSVFEVGEAIEAGGTVSVSGITAIDVSSHPIIACGVKGYSAQSGNVLFDYEQLLFVTSRGDMIYPKDESGILRSISAEDYERARTIRLGYAYTVIPYYAATDYMMPAGQLITAVDPDSPAERAGLQVGDVLISFSGDPSTRAYADEFVKLKLLNGEKVALDYWRDNQTYMAILALDISVYDSDALTRYSELLSTGAINQNEYNILVAAFAEEN